MDDVFDRKGVPPDHGGAGLGPWTFRVGSVDSFGRYLYGCHYLRLRSDS
jgi:hypothetical protein